MTVREKLSSLGRRLIRRKPKDGRVGYSLAEIAEGSSMLPGEVEKTVRDLQKRGLVRIYWYKGQAWVVVEKGKSPEDIRAFILNEEKQDPSVR